MPPSSCSSDKQNLSFRELSSEARLLKIVNRSFIPRDSQLICALSPLHSDSSSLGYR